MSRSLDARSRSGAGALQALDRRSEEGEAHQLEEQLEKLFHEKAQTSRGAWDRLFNETMTALRFAVEGERRRWRWSRR